MSNKWEEKSSKEGNIDPLATAVNFLSGIWIGDVLTGNSPIIRDPKEHVVTNTETGKDKQITTNGSVGEKIAKGDFDKK